MTSIDELSARVRTLISRLSKEERALLMRVIDQTLPRAEREDAADRLYESGDAARELLATSFSLVIAFFRGGKPFPTNAPVRNT